MAEGKKNRWMATVARDIIVDVEQPRCSAVNKRFTRMLETVQATMTTQPFYAVPWDRAPLVLQIRDAFKHLDTARHLYGNASPDCQLAARYAAQTFGRDVTLHCQIEDHAEQSSIAILTIIDAFPSHLRLCRFVCAVILVRRPGRPLSRDMNVMLARLVWEMRRNT